MRSAGNRSQQGRPARTRICCAKSQPENAHARRRRLRALGVERDPLLSREQTAAERAWPCEARAQADVARWLAWQSAHWDAESCGMVAFEKASKSVLGL